MLLKTFANRGIFMLAAHPRNVRMISQIHKVNYQINNNSRLIVPYQRRFFGDNSWTSSDEEEQAKEEEPAEEAVEETVEEPAVEAAEEVVEEAVQEPEEVPVDFSAASEEQPPQEVAQDLFSSFDVGSINQVNSAPDNKPPISEDTIEGRYAGVLFSTASEQESLFAIYEDVTYLRALFKESEAFYLFTQNAGVGSKEIQQFNEALQSVATFNPLTIKFLEILAENKRLSFIGGIAERYQKLYQLLNREEKITIISAEELDSGEQGEVLEALKANPQNEGKEFKLEFTIDPTIKGGLQMYTETEFMDMSLQSRITMLKSEVSKFVE